MRSVRTAPRPGPARWWRLAIALPCMLVGRERVQGGSQGGEESAESRSELMTTDTSRLKRPRGRPKGSRNKSPSLAGHKYEVSGAVLAKDLNISLATLERVRAIIASGEGDIIDPMSSGEMSP